MAKKFTHLSWKYCLVFMEEETSKWVLWRSVVLSEISGFSSRNNTEIKDYITLDNNWY